MCFAPALGLRPLRSLLASLQYYLACANSFLINCIEYYFLAVIGIVATSLLAWINRGAYNNALIPAYAGLAILFGLGIGWLTEHYEFSRLSRNLFQSVLWLAIAAQFILLEYNPFQQIPTQADRRAGDALVD